MDKKCFDVQHLFTSVITFHIEQRCVPSSDTPGEKGEEKTTRYRY